MTARNAPLMLIGTAIVGWIGLRGLFVLLSVPVSGLPPPLFVVDTGEDNFTILPSMLRTDLDAPMANVPNLDQPLPQMAGLSAHMVHSAVATAARTPTQTQPTLPLIPRNNVVVAAQALLLDRMLGLRPQVGRPIGHGAPALIMSGHAPAFIPARRASADAWSITAGLYVRQGSGRTNFGPGPPARWVSGLGAPRVATRSSWTASVCARQQCGTHGSQRRDRRPGSPCGPLAACLCSWLLNGAKGLGEKDAAPSRPMRWLALAANIMAGIWTAMAPPVWWGLPARMPSRRIGHCNPDNCSFRRDWGQRRRRRMGRCPARCPAG